MDFRAFYETHVRFVWRGLVRAGVAEAELPDAVQDVFLVVHRKLDQFENRSSLTTWLFGICIRVASDRRRKAHVRHEISSTTMPVAHVEMDDEELDRRRARAVLEAILARMPDEQRLVFSLFELEGMTGEEIAALLEIPVGTVRSRLRLSRAVFDDAVSRLQRRPLHVDASWKASVAR
mgnify:CR=1 FL=1